MCRWIGFVVALAACGNAGTARVGTDAPAAALDYAHCESHVGTAALTAAGANLQPYYGRMFAGGVFSGEGDCGLPTLGFDVRAFFTNESPTDVQDVIACEGGTSCANVGIFVEAVFDRSAAIGAHAAMVRDSASTWTATGTITFTDLVFPQDVVGHVAGSLHVDGATAIDGTFDTTFCPGLVEAVL